MCAGKTSFRVAWLAVKEGIRRVTSEEYCISGNLRGTSQVFVEDHRHGALSYWFLNFYAGTWTSLHLYEVGTERRSPYVARSEHRTNTHWKGD